jgi:hypothetical protein
MAGCDAAAAIPPDPKAMKMAAIKIAAKPAKMHAARRFAAAACALVLFASAAQQAAAQGFNPPVPGQNIEPPVDGVAPITIPADFTPPADTTSEEPTPTGEPPLAGDATYPTAVNDYYQYLLDTGVGGTPLATDSVNGSTYTLKLANSADAQDSFTETVVETPSEVAVTVNIASPAGSLLLESDETTTGDVTNGAALSESLDDSGQVTGMVFLSEGSGSPTVQPSASVPVPEPGTLALSAAALLAAGVRFALAAKAVEATEEYGQRHKSRAKPQRKTLCAFAPLRDKSSFPAYSFLPHFSVPIFLSYRPPGGLRS